MPVYLFECACGWQGDRIAETRQTHERCPSCGGKASKRFSPPVMALILVAGTERMTATELSTAHENKRSIEARADEIRDGRVEVSTKSTVALELRPQIPRTLY